MSQEPKVTRFGADPTVAQELATKAYVDAGGGGGGVLALGGGSTANDTATSIRFIAMIGPTGGLFTNETFAQTRLYNGATLTDYGVTVQTNTKGAADSSSAFRDDAVDVVGSVVTIPASTTGVFENTGFSTAIADDSLISFRQTGTSGGSLRISAIMARLTVP